MAFYLNTDKAFASIAFYYIRQIKVFIEIDRIEDETKKEDKMKIQRVSLKLKVN